MVPILFTSITKDRSQVDLDNPEYALRYVLAVAENISFKVTQILQAYYHQIRLTGFFLPVNRIVFFLLYSFFKTKHMKKILLLGTIATAVIIFSNCSASKKAAAVPKSTYDGSVQTLIMTSCVPCHVPSKGGNKKSYDNYTNVKTDIDEILRRIQLNPGEKGYMPFKKPKLSDSAIAVFKIWKADGLLEH